MSICISYLFLVKLETTRFRSEFAWQEIAGCELGSKLDVKTTFLLQKTKLDRTRVPCTTALKKWPDFVSVQSRRRTRFNSTVRLHHIVVKWFLCFDWTIVVSSWKGWRGNLMRNTLETSLNSCFGVGNSVFTQSDLIEKCGNFLHQTELCNGFKGTFREIAWQEILIFCLVVEMRVSYLQL